MRWLAVFLALLFFTLFPAHGLAHHYPPVVGFLNAPAVKMILEGPCLQVSMRRMLYCEALRDAATGDEYLAVWRLDRRILLQVWRRDVEFEQDRMIYSAETVRHPTQPMHGVGLSYY